MAGIQTLAVIPLQIMDGSMKDVQPATQKVAVLIADGLAKKTGFKYVPPRQVMAAAQQRGDVANPFNTIERTESERKEFLAQLTNTVNADGYILATARLTGEVGIMGPSGGGYGERTITVSVFEAKTHKLLWHQKAVAGFGIHNFNYAVDTSNADALLVDALVENFAQTAK